jgi:hypothetical protein
VALAMAGFGPGQGHAPEYPSFQNRRGTFFAPGRAAVERPFDADIVEPL